MKPYGTTILLAVVCGALGAYVYWIDLPAVEQAIVQETTASRLLPFDYRDISTVTLQTETDTITLTMDDQYRWRLIEPIEAPADPREVGNVLRALDLGKVTRTMPLPDNGLKEYGLDPPHLTITMKTDHVTDTLLLGDVAPVSNTLYVKRRGEDRVILSSLSVKDFRKKSSFTFRQKEILPFNRMQVDTVTVRFHDQEYTLAQIPAVHGTTGEWEFRSPWKRPADKTAVGLLLMNLESLSANGFLDPGPKQVQLAQQLGAPHFSVTLRRGQRRLDAAFFRPQTPDGPAYAMRSLDYPLYEISPEFLKQLPRNPFDLQDKRLLGIKADEIALLTVTGPKVHYVLVRQHGEWMLEENTGLALDNQKVNLFVSRLADLPVERQVQAGEDQLREFGLDPPIYTISATDRRGRPRGRLLIGKRTQGLIYVKGAGLPGVYQARSLILTQIPDPQDLPLVLERP